jgi:hypothetical protein
MLGQNLNICKRHQHDTVGSSPVRVMKSQAMTKLWRMGSRSAHNSG